MECGPTLAEAVCHHRPREIDDSEDAATGEISRADSKLPTRASRHGKLTRLFTDWSFGVRVLRYALHLSTPLDTEGRRTLEQVVFKSLLAQANTKKVSFVGCDWYTRHYEQTSFAVASIGRSTLRPMCAASPASDISSRCCRISAGTSPKSTVRPRR
jgi:hypothetical protein